MAVPMVTREIQVDNLNVDTLNATDKWPIARYPCILGPVLDNFLFGESIACDLVVPRVVSSKGWHRG